VDFPNTLTDLQAVSALQREKSANYLSAVRGAEKNLVKQGVAHASFVHGNLTVQTCTNGKNVRCKVRRDSIVDRKFFYEKFYRTRDHYERKDN